MLFRSSLGSSVHGQGRNTELACDAADVDDTAAAGHVWKSGLDEKERTSDVGAKDIIPSCCWDGSDFGMESCLACVVDNDVNCFGV